MKKRLPDYVLLPILGILLVVLSMGALVLGQTETDTYLPIVFRPLPTPTFTPMPTPTATPTPSPTPTPPPGSMVEMRALWVSRFDWLNAYNTTKIDEIVNNVAYAGFNAIFFQVRGEADAYYNSAYEPWSRRLTGTLGQYPGWDPLAYMIQQAHARGIQVHAYINVYPVWEGCSAPPDGTTPRHLYYLIRDYHGLTGGKLNGLQWNTSGDVICASYQRSSPASAFVDDHLMNITADLLAKYDLDGLHLDHIRYNWENTSCDPVSAAASGVPCFSTPPAGYGSYGDWQRAQVNGTVWKFYQRLFGAGGVAPKPNFWLSAAVWPSYSTGYNSYFQDPKAWLGYYGGGGYIDAASPMIYPATYNCPDNSFWTQTVWYNTVADYQNSRNGRYIVPGIGAGYCTFDEIAARIAMARQLGTAGHAIFSYSGLLANGYFDDLRNGPYAAPAVVPGIGWHN